MLILANGIKIKWKEKENILMMAILHITVNERKINKMAMGRKYGQMELNILDNIIKGKSKGKGSYIGLMETLLMVSFKIMKFMEMEFIFGYSLFF